LFCFIKWFRMYISTRTKRLYHHGELTRQTKKEKKAPLSRNTGSKISYKEILRPKKGDRTGKIEKRKVKNFLAQPFYLNKDRKRKEN